MSGWMYDGYTKFKAGTGRRAKMVENHIFKCLHCGWSVRVERTEKPPRYCPNCRADNWIKQEVNRNEGMESRGHTKL